MSCIHTEWTEWAVGETDCECHSLLFLGLVLQCTLYSTTSVLTFIINHVQLQSWREVEGNSRRPNIQRQRKHRLTCQSVGECIIWSLWSTTSTENIHQSKPQASPTNACALKDAPCFSDKKQTLLLSVYETLTTKCKTTAVNRDRGVCHTFSGFLICKMRCKKYDNY